MRRKAQVLAGLVLVLMLAGTVTNLLSYPETEDEDVFAATQLPGGRKPPYSAFGDLPLLYDPADPAGGGPFPQGLLGVRPEAPVQGKIYDCRFITALTSLASTEGGRRAIFEMIAQNPDGSMTVTFPGAKAEPVTVAPVSPEEAEIVAYVAAGGRRIPTTWVSVIEKAYGRFRGAHQEFFEFLVHFLRHGIWYGRWNAAPRLDPAGASYGMADDKAIRILTGDSYVFLDTFSMQCGEFGLGKGYVTWAQIKSWFDRKGVLEELMDEQHRLLTNESRHGLVGVVLTDLAYQNAAVGMRHNHAYAILGYDPKTCRIRLRDPYGKGDFIDPTTGWPRDGQDDGIFEISLEELNLYTSHIALRIHDHHTPERL